jgi:hypothetical protein
VRDRREGEPFRVGDVDRAPVGELGYEQPRQALERPRLVERRRQELAGLRQDPLRHLGALHRGDVVDHVDRQLRAPVAVEHRGRLDDGPALQAGGPVHRAHDERARVLARQHAAAGEVIDAQRPPVLCEGGVAVDDLARRRGEQLLGGLEAEQHRGRVVGVDQGAVRVLHGDGLGQAAQRRAQPRLDGLQLGEQARVVERERRTAAEDARELQVVRLVARRRRAQREAQRPQRPPARPQRDHDRRARLGAGQRVAVGLVARERAHRGLRRAGQKLGTASMDDRVGRRGRRPIGGPAVQHRLEL